MPILHYRFFECVWRLSDIMSRKHLSLWHVDIHSVKGAYYFYVWLMGACWQKYVEKLITCIKKFYIALESSINIYWYSNLATYFPQFVSCRFSCLVLFWLYLEWIQMQYQILPSLWSLPWPLIFKERFALLSTKIMDCTQKIVYWLCNQSNQSQLIFDLLINSLIFHK